MLPNECIYNLQFVHVCVSVCAYLNPSTILGNKFKCGKMQIDGTQCNMIIFLVGAAMAGELLLFLTLCQR